MQGNGDRGLKESLGPTIKIGGHLVTEDILTDVSASVPPSAELGHAAYRHLKISEC